jgi:hypothetical protein
MFTGGYFNGEGLRLDSVSTARRAKGLLVQMRSKNLRLKH